MVTAFLLAGLPARPFWNSSLLGPRFLASAFAAGPAFMILLLHFIRSNSPYTIRDETIAKLAMITTVAAQINLIMLGSELFKEFYRHTHHSQSAYYLFFGLDGHGALRPWIWTAITMNVLRYERHEPPFIAKESEMALSGMYHVVYSHLDRERLRSCNTRIYSVTIRRNC